jgi:hypothetical protein
MFPIFVLFMQLTTAQIDAVKASYKALGDQVEAHKATEQPPKDAEKIDISPRIRSASFGHKTWLVVTPDAKSFWVEYGRSTNKPGGLYGPFPVEAATGAGGNGGGKGSGYGTPGTGKLDPAKPRPGKPAPEPKPSKAGPGRPDPTE